MGIIDPDDDEAMRWTVGVLSDEAREIIEWVDKGDLTRALAVAWHLREGATQVAKVLVKHVSEADWEDLFRTKFQTEAQKKFMKETPAAVEKIKARQKRQHGFEDELMTAIRRIFNV